MKDHKSNYLTTPTTEVNHQIDYISRKSGKQPKVLSLTASKYQLGNKTNSILNRSLNKHQALHCNKIENNNHLLGPDQ